MRRRRTKACSSVAFNRKEHSVKPSVIVKAGISAVVLLGCLVPGLRASAAGAGYDSANPIVIENLHQGSNRWQVPWNGFTVADDNQLEIKGYAGSESAAPGGTDYTLLSASPFINYLNKTMTQNSSIYRSRAGNWVWTSGSMDWAWGLSPGGSSNGGYNVRRSLQVMTRNIFDRIIHDAPNGV
jgi:hypothetical protein